MDTEQPLDPRRREAHPERITIGGETFIRNDIQARELGESERSLNRGDRHGAPFRFFGGVKYRPERRYAEFVMNSIQVRKSPMPERKRTHEKPRRKAAARSSPAILSPEKDQS
jgi:hypothetical protein